MDDECDLYMWFIEVRFSIIRPILRDLAQYLKIGGWWWWWWFVCVCLCAYKPIKVSLKPLFRFNFFPPTRLNFQLFLKLIFFPHNSILPFCLLLQVNFSIIWSIRLSGSTFSAQELTPFLNIQLRRYLGNLRG